jgi:hypothetical protein
MSKFTFGLDPEFMLVKDGKYISAIGVIPGTKEKRYEIDGDSFYYDNVLAEMTVKPSRNKNEAIKNIGTALRKFAKLAAPHRLVAQASQKYPKDQLTHDDAIAIGCSRECCVYALREIDPPEDKMKGSPLRSAGGHIHIGMPFAQNSLGCFATIRMLDLFLGIPAVLLDNDPSSPARKELYGQAGRFRKPAHGAEYRSLGNFWLSSPKLTGLVYDICDFAVDFLHAGNYDKMWSVNMERLTDPEAWNEDGFDPASCHQCIGYNVKEVRDAIDNFDKKAAAELMVSVVKKYIPKALYNELDSACAAAADSKPFDLCTQWEIG